MLDLASRSRIINSDLGGDRMLHLQSLWHSLEDPDLAPVRDAENLGKLPEPERKEWQTFWADVNALVKQAEASKP